MDQLKQPTLSGVVTFASNALNSAVAIAGVLDKIGVSKDAAKTVSKFVSYAKFAVSLATSLFPPNPLGIIDALGSLAYSVAEGRVLSNK
jgi:hypothetical protein